MGLRITFLHPQPSLAGGCKTVCRLADGLVGRGHDVRLVFGGGAPPWPPPWKPRRFLRRTEDALRDRLHPQDAFVRATRAAVIRLPREELRPHEVPDGDVVIATWWKTAVDMARFPPERGVKLYYVQADEPLLVGPEDAERVRSTHREPFRHLCVSAYLQEKAMRDYGHDEAEWVPLGVDDVFRAHVALRAGPPTVGVLFSRAPVKGWPTALEALRLVQERIPSLHIAAFGTSPPHASEALPNMRFELRPPQAKIVSLATRAHVWLVPSHSEGFGLPGIEAAATGTPVVTTRCGGPADYVREGENGFLVDVGDARAMADALIRVLSADAFTWMAMSAASVRIAADFRWPTAVRRFEEALLSAVAAGPLKAPPYERSAQATDGRVRSSA